MNYFDIYDFLEQLFKHRVINKKIFSFLSIEHRDKVLSLIKWGTNNSIINESGEEITLLKPVELLISLPMFGLVPDRFSVYVDWHEFEQYISKVLTELNWDVHLNYRHTRTDRFQIDVIAINVMLKTALFIECKHWRRASKMYVSIDRIVEDHLKRIEKYTRNCEWVCTKISRLRIVKNILPVVVTLNDFQPKVYNGVPIVPVHKFVDFVVNVDSYIDALNLTIYRNRCYVGSD